MVDLVVVVGKSEKSESRKVGKSNFFGESESRKVGKSEKSESRKVGKSEKSV